MISVVLIIVFLLVALFIFKLEHLGKVIKISLLVVIAALLYFSVTSVISTADVDLDSPKGVLNSVTLYFRWLGNAISNLADISGEVKDTVSEAIDMNLSSKANR